MGTVGEETVLDILTPGELQLIRIVREAEQFTTYGWDRYGADWPARIPTLANASEWASEELRDAAGSLLDGSGPPRPVINAFTRYFFGGFSFQQHQALMHYCPIQDIQVMGGVGSGKTTPTAVSAAARICLNPGYRVLWVAPILSQAKLSYEVVLQWGLNSRWGQVFLKNHRRHPFPLIEFRPWDRFDPGGVFECRSLGQDPAEMLRGGEFDEAAADEAMRAYITTWYIALITGRLRGPRPYMLNAFPELREEYAARVEEIEWCEDPLARAALREELEFWCIEVGVAKRTRLTVIGNAPKGAEWWRRWEWGHSHPDQRYSTRWSTRQNMYVTREQIELQLRQFRGREEEAAVELDAARPRAGGDVFPYLDSFFSGDLLEQAIRKVADEEKGWVVKTWEEYGVYHYEKPPDPSGAYIFALDPGSGILGQRNQWVLLGARIDTGPHTPQGGPFEIVYARGGNLPGAHGSPDPWIEAAKDVRSRYRIAYEHFAVESSGVQKNTHHVIWRDDLILTPFFLNNVMHTLIIEAQRTLGADMWWCPEIPLFAGEMAEFKYVMGRDEPQDWVCAFLLLNHLAYAYVQDRWEPPEEEEEEYWEAETYHREVRDAQREVRIR